MEFGDLLVGLQSLADPEKVGAGGEMQEGFAALFEMLGRSIAEIADIHSEIGRRRSEALQAEADEKRDGLRVVE